MGEPRLEPVRGSEVIIADDGYKLFLRNWRDPGRSSGKGIIVFLVHGMAEHSERYDELAGGLVSALPSGSIVYAHDQRGHERTAAELGGGLASLGEVSCPQSSDPISVLAGDLVLLVKTKVPADTEYCLVGHSMGSIIVRLALVELVKQGLPIPSGVLLSGPPAAPGRALNFAYQSVLWIARVVGLGPSLASKIIFGGYDSQTRALTNDATLPQHSWISSDESSVKRYTEDPLCGHDVSLPLWASILGNLSRLTDYRAVFDYGPPCSPVKVLVMGGSDDMCTLQGRGVIECASAMSQVPGLPVKHLLYARGRDELWHEVSGIRKEAIQDTIRWVLSCSRHNEERSRL